MLKKSFYVLLFALVSGAVAHAQQKNLTPLPLDDLSSFRNQAGNWSIVGDVTIDRTVDIHPHEETSQPVQTKKSKKVKTPVVTAPVAVTSTPGTGILLNMNDDSKKDNLVTNLEHGDIELEFEVMLPKGSNSGVYLQGRYEIQLLDSWGIKNPAYSDIGGIYRNWETDPAKIYMGKAPTTNAARAPGLWQKFKITFRAPRFDASGKKISNARFVSVMLNNVEIHSNVEVPQPTGGPIENNEKPMGPIMIQGDHGPVAIRNVKYRLLKELDYKVSEVTYDIFHGKFSTTDDFASSKPVLSGTSPELSAEVLDVEDGYGVRYRGNITVPEDGTYTLTTNASGGTKLIFNQKQLISYQKFDGWRRDTGTIELKAGTYPFEILNFKRASWLPPRLALYIQSENSYPKALHALNSFPPSGQPTSSIFIEPGSEPRMLRAFLDFNGDHAKRLTHTIGVGDPVGLNYAYDLKSGNLACVWRGNFADATPMWHDRGDGSFKPNGAPLFLHNSQALAYLSSDQEEFPAAAKEGDLISRGYIIDEATHRPVFLLSYRGLEIEDRVSPDDENRILSHSLVVKGTRDAGLYYKLAEGSSIVALPDGSFAVNDKQYYVMPGAGMKPFIRDVNGKKELVTTFTTPSLKYSIIW
jgi:hypothetical protein